MASAYAGAWPAPGASSDTAAWGGTPSDAAAWSAYYAQYPQGSYSYPANAYYGYQGYAGYPPPAPAEEATKAQPPAPGDEPPPLPLDEAPPGAAASGSEASATTTSATIPPAPPGAPAPPVPAITSPFAPVAAAAPAYDHAAYHQYYQQYYSAYGQYPQAHNASAYAAPQGYIAPHSAPAHTQPPNTQHSMSYSMSQSMSQELPKTPRPPPGGPPTSTFHNSYNSVPPPNALTGSNKIPVNGLRHQYNIKPNQPAYASATARHPSGSTVTSTTAPAFIRADPAPKPSQPNATPSASSAKPPAGAGKFPPSFNTWVERCFERCRNDIERQAMTGKLTVRIKAVEATGSMWGVDWDKEPIPDLNAPTPSPGNLPSPSSQGGLPSKRSRWEESNTTQHQLQHPNQKGAPKKQQANQKNKKQKTDSKWDPNWSRVEESRRAERAGRFGNNSVGRTRNRGYDSDEDGSDWSEGGTGGVIVVGTSSNLEKSYFRLTGPPDPAEVRPPQVLRKALDRLVRLLREDAVTTFYTLDQFKGLRQDCTVQHLRNELAVEVYEAHARSSLEYGDLAEFNQCQTQLAAMYTEGVPGCVVEFTAYKLLYNVVHARSGANKALLHTLKAALTQQRSAPDPYGAIANALAVRAAMAAGNHPAFFAAYAQAPALGRALLDSIVPHVRWSALNVMVKAYKTSLPLSFVARALGFIASRATAAPGSTAGKGAVALPGCRQAEFTGKAVAAATEDEGVQACSQWLQAHGAVLEAADTASPLLDVKSSMGKLFIPEEPKVAHGDDNLSLTDFLARASGLKA